MSTLHRIAPFLLVEDVRLAAEYYRDKLGFEIAGYWFEEPPVFAIVRRGGATISLRRVGSRGGSNRKWEPTALDAYIWADDVDALYREFTAKHADLVGPPQGRSYGMKELEVRDRDGYVLCFGQEIAAQPQ